MEIPMMVFCSVIAIGVLAIAALKSGHADELMRLSKQKRRLADRDRDNAEDDENGDRRHRPLQVARTIARVASADPSPA